MSIQKEKKIKKLKKNHAWASILLMLITVLCFTLVIVVFINVFAIFMVYTKMNEADTHTENVAHVIEGQLERGEAAARIVAEIGGVFQDDNDLCVLDEQNKIVASYGKSLPDLSKKGVLELEKNYTIYTDKATGMNWNMNENGMDIDLSQVFFDTLNPFFEDNAIGDKWADEVIVDGKYWLEKSIPYNQYRILEKHSLQIKRSDMIYVCAIAVVSFIIVLIPIILLLFNMIRSAIIQKRLTKLIYLDTLTGGNNWFYFKERAAKLLKRRRNSSKHYAMLSLQMNKYQSFCNCYGNVAGEDLLENFYRLIEKAVRKNEMFARNGKSDFGILLYYEEIDNLYGRIKSFLKLLDEQRKEQKLSFCVGIYLVSDRKMEIDTMYNYAVGARLEADNQVADNIVMFDNQMLEKQLWERTVEDTMEEAMQKKEFNVYLQPKYSTKEEVLSGAEALVRWISPEKGFIPPNRFIPIFEKNGFIIKLDDYMISEVAKKQSEWIAEGRKVVPVSVNVSRAHFTREDLADHICKLVDTYHTPHNVIELELTESAFFDDKEVLLKTVNRLKEYGFAISMDDFGAGYSSLNSLKDLPLDVVKLDAEFFRGNADNQRGEIVVKEAIHLAKNLDMKIVAEGIETREQVDFLASQDCDLIQGFYFARPMPLSEFEEAAFGKNEEN